MPNEKKLHTCEYCGNDYVRLRKHHKHQHPDLPFTPPEKTPLERTHACTKCEKKFTCTAHLRRHEKSVHQVVHIKCPVPHCNKIFTDQTIVDRHVEEVHPNPQLEHPQLEEERKKKKEKMPIVCTVCDTSFKFQSRLKSHMKKHRKKEVECPNANCTMVFLRRSDLTKHIAAKHNNTETNLVDDSTVQILENNESSEKKRFACSVCDMSFDMRGHLNRHERSHTGEKPFKCEIESCTQSFTRKENLLHHIDSVHKPRMERQVHKCPHCDEDFIKESGLIKHLEKHKLGTLYNCEECPAVFGKKWKLNRHLYDAHGQEGNFECEYENCGRKFIRLSLLQLHIRRRHTLHFCFEPECAHVDPFSNRNQLNNHNRKFHPPSPDGFVCDKCGRQCFSQRGFSRHMNWHKETEVKAKNMFRCDFPFCKHQYALKSDLVKHVSEKHLRKRPRKELPTVESNCCPICAENLPNNDKLVEHLRNEHDVTDDQMEELVGEISNGRKKRKPSPKRMRKASVSDVSEDEPKLDVVVEEWCKNNDVHSSLNETEVKEYVPDEIESIQINSKAFRRAQSDIDSSSDEGEDEEEVVYMDESSEAEEYIFYDEREDINTGASSPLTGLQ